MFAQDFVLQIISLRMIVTVRAGKTEIEKACFSPSA